MTTTYRNTRTNETVSTDLTRDEIARRFAEIAREDSWLWYWLAKDVETARSRPAPCAATANMQGFIADSFMFAIGMGLQRPMIRVYFKARRYKVYLSGKGTICFKTGATDDHGHPVGDEEYMGCIARGSFLAASPSQYNRDPYRMNDNDREFLRNLSTDPVAFLAQCSRDMDRCAYCALPLEDARSKVKGYGPVCAGRWGLPWGDETTGEEVPSFAELWARSDNTTQRNVRGMMNALRADPYDVVSWEILGDLLEEAGHTKRPTCPDRKVTVPRV